mmetsp:Transcript_27721/g.44663  ORF Transcript_27721/g.44663 Transcript_27721/m.44663 type:complete len:200 (-) Transcript_27721:219-818(-)
MATGIGQPIYSSTSRSSVSDAGSRRLHVVSTDTELATLFHKRLATWYACIRLQKGESHPIQAEEEEEDSYSLLMPLKIRRATLSFEVVEPWLLIQRLHISLSSNRLAKHLLVPSKAANAFISAYSNIRKNMSLFNFSSVFDFKSKMICCLKTKCLVLRMAFPPPFKCCCVNTTTNGCDRNKQRIPLPSFASGTAFPSRS